MIKYIRKPRLKDPYLVAAWPGMGNVAIKAAEYLWEALKPVEFAQLTAEGFFYPHDAWIVNSQIEFPRLPAGKFYYWRNPQGGSDIIIFLCEAQPSLEKGYNYAQLVLEVAKDFKVKKVFTFASMPTPIDHTQTAKVWASATDKKMLKELEKIDVELMRVGQISGLNGLLMSVAKEQKMHGICFLAEIPMYAIQIENPKAAKAVLNIFAQLVGLKIDFTGLDERAKMVEDEIEKLVDYFKTGATLGPISEEEIEKVKQTLSFSSRLPESAKAKIEELFKVAQIDLSRANELKDELDRWHIYKDYEDRFLDLFKPNKKDNHC
ncbi:MAG: PAC2 family protein [Candidatus Omnitrophota bacterium]